VPTISQELKHSLIHKILAGQYPVGSRLPSCRDLARDLGVNRNTVSKVYRELAEEGFVKIVRGVGAVVTRRQSAATTPPPSIQEHIQVAAREARLLGMGRDEFLKTVVEVANNLFQTTHPTIAFVECNQQDAISLAREVEAEVSSPLQPVLLSDLERDPRAIVSAYDLICTTLYHLSAVTKAVGQAEDRIIAIHAPPDPDTLLDIARLDPKTRVGIICEEPTTQQYLTSAVAMVFPGETMSCLVADSKCLAELARSAEVVIDVPSCHEKVVRLFPTTPILTVRFRVDSKSVAPLRERIARLRHEETSKILVGV
jgi:DNA-binding transcriptional regulator YhcF (GntR family)